MSIIYLCRNKDYVECKCKLWILLHKSKIKWKLHGLMPTAEVTMTALPRTFIKEVKGYFSIR